MSLQTFTEAYVTCALWSTTYYSHDAERNELATCCMDAKYSATDIHPTAMHHIKVDCEEFYLAHCPFLTNVQYKGANDPVVQAGRDFWLTRNNHGTGFWDGDWTVGDMLTKAADGRGTRDLYIGDDGKIHYT